MLKGRGKIYIISGEYFLRLTAPGAYVDIETLPGITIEGTSPDEDVNVAFSGSFDGDSRKDLVVGSSGYDAGSLTDAGRICMFKGGRFSQFGGLEINPVDIESFDLSIIGPNNHARCTIGFGADLNSDSRDELIISGITADAYGINIRWFGGRDHWTGSGTSYGGAYYSNLDSNSVKVTRFSNDTAADSLRVRIWIVASE